MEREPFEDAPQESGLEEEMSGEKLSEDVSKRQAVFAALTSCSFSAAAGFFFATITFPS